MLQLKAIKEVIALVWPIIQEVLKALRDSEVRAVANQLKQAKTPEEKRDAARKIADHIYKS